MHSCGATEPLPSFAEPTPVFFRKPPLHLGYLLIAQLVAIVLSVDYSLSPSLAHF
jgi:hypothetical protein